MEIPYTFTARPVTGLYNGKLGIWLFLASEVMLFGAIFTAYLFMRLGAEDGTWPTHIQNVWLGLANTIILIISSITMVWAWVALKERKFNTYRLALAITILCGVVFLCIKGVEYKSKFEHYGFFIKEEAMDKYLPEIKKQNIFYSAIPSQHVFEVRGHLHPSESPDVYTFLPDKNPSYLIDLTKGEKGASSAEVTAGPEEETPFNIDKADVERWG